MRSTCTDNRAWQEVEAQQVQPRRGLQGMRAVSGGGYAGADHADRRRGRHLRHGRPQPPANLAVHPAVCQENSRSASGGDTCEGQELTRREPAGYIQHGVRSVQTVPEREVEEQDNLPRLRPQIVASVHIAETSAAAIRRYVGTKIDKRTPMVLVAGKLGQGIRSYLFVRLQKEIVSQLLSSS